jgi:hypothetical protein
LCAGGLGGVCKPGWGSGSGLFFDDGTGLIPNEIGQNDDDMKMIGTDGFTTDKKGNANICRRDGRLLDICLLLKCMKVLKFL